jgi:hypothetical protein
VTLKEKNKILSFGQNLIIEEKYIEITIGHDGIIGILGE